MRTIRIDYRDIPSLPASVCALGYFDGLHVGHQQLMNTAIEQARFLGIQSAALTFDPDPWKVLKPNAPNLDHLCDLEDKEKLMAAAGLDLFYIVEFTKGFADLSIDEFHDFLKALNIKEIVCGFDYTYGKMGKGDVRTLAKCPYFKVDVIEQVSDHNEKISSSRIESLIENGKVDQANTLLGYVYSIKGIVVHGYERGRILGYPTANLDQNPGSVLPGNGVYAGYVVVKDTMLPAMINVGRNPTFNNKAVTIEANLLNFHGDLYGQSTRFFFVCKLRDELKFDGLQGLIDQLGKDQKNTPEALVSFHNLVCATAKLWSLHVGNAIIEK